MDEQQAVNPVTNPLGALQAMALRRTNEQDSYIQQQQVAQNKRMEELSRMAQGSPEADSAEQWGAMAEGAASVPAVYGGFGQMLAQMGANYGKTVGAQDQQNFTRHQAVAKMAGDELRALESRNAMAALFGRGAAGVRGVITRQQKDGTVIVVDKATGNEVRRFDPNESQTYVELLKAALKQSENLDTQDPAERNSWATQQALAGLAAARAAVGNKSPAPGSPNAVVSPSTPPGGEVKSVKPNSPEDELAELERLQKLHRDNPIILGSLRERQAKLAQSLIDKGGGNGLQMRDNIAQPVDVSADGTVAPKTQFVDPVRRTMEKGTAEETGKALGKELTALNEGYAASGKMLTQLDLMEKLYNTPNMPEGELGQHLQNIRSGLKKLGVAVGPEVGAADIARAVASNFALHLRTGEGSNLLPGAMSNYEDQLLQKMSPVLSLTSEGRLALVQFMREMSKSNMRMAQEANALAKNNKSGVLPIEWHQRRERVMREEMARLAVVNREIAAKFQGAK